MDVIYKNFNKGHIPDNEAHYFDLVESVIASVDNYSTFVITRNPRTYTFRLSTSSRIVNPLIKQLNIINSAYSIQTNFSKSMKSGSLFWQIELF